SERETNADGIADSVWRLQYLSCCLGQLERSRFAGHDIPYRAGAATVPALARLGIHRHVSALLADDSGVFLVGLPGWCLSQEPRLEDRLPVGNPEDPGSPNTHRD